MTPGGLVDGYCRKINYLRVSVTDRCNLRCIYCMPAEGLSILGHGEILSYEEIIRVVRLSVELGIRKVRVTGGEPLVRKGIVGLIGELAQIPKIVDLALTTNGILLPGMARDLKNAGLMRVNISLDTLKPERFAQITRFDGLSKVLEGVDAAIAAGLAPVKINVVAMKGVNDDEVLDFARFASDKKVEVRFIEYMPSRREDWTPERLLSADEIISAISSQFALTPKTHSPDTHGPCRAFTLPGGGGIGVISAVSDHFCASCNRLRLTAEGRLRGCLFSSAEFDLKAALRSGASDEDLKQLLSSAVLHKPQGHTLATGTGENITMSKIGG